MSTRAQIVVEGLEEVKFYKHSDGYPIGVLPVLEPFLKGFLKRRGWDPEYLLARLVMAFGLTDIGGVDGYGLMPYWAVDIAWFYRIRQDGVIECWRTRESWWEACLAEEGFRPEEHSERLEGPWDWQNERWAKRMEELVLEVWG